MITSPFVSHAALEELVYVTAAAVRAGLEPPEKLPWNRKQYAEAVLALLDSRHGAVMRKDMLETLGGEEPAC